METVSQLPSSQLPSPCAQCRAPPPDARSPAPELWLLLHCISKGRNIGSLLRTAVAFGASGVLVCGGSKNPPNTHGAKGAHLHANVMAFPGRAGLAEAVAWLRTRRVRLLGIEIDAHARDVTTHPFGDDDSPWRGTAFLPGHETSGLSPAVKALCDGFVYIPQCSAGTASLNVAAATAIVLHHYATWARFAEAPRAAGQDKFAVAAPPQWDGTRTEAQALLAARRAEARVEAAAAAEAEAEAEAAAEAAERECGGGGGDSGIGALFAE